MLSNPPKVTQLVGGGAKIESRWPISGVHTCNHYLIDTTRVYHPVREHDVSTARWCQAECKMWESPDRQTGTYPLWPREAC